MPWMPGVERIDAPTYGACDPRVVVGHKTIGREPGDRSVGLQGKFHFYVTLDGDLVQYADTTRKCAHAGEANPCSVGIEAEDIDNSGRLNPAQINNIARILKFMHEQHGVPLSLYDGARIDVCGSGYRGLLNHRNIKQTDPHYDYWDPADWAQAIAIAKGEFVIMNLQDGIQIDKIVTNAINKLVIPRLTALEAAVANAPGGTAVVDYPAVAKAVADEIARRGAA